MLRRFHMVAMAALICASAAASAAPDQSGFTYDKGEALDLGLAYAKPLAGTVNGSGVELDLSTPTVLARTFKGNRHLILISYESNRKDVSANVTLEQLPGHTPLAMVNWSLSNGCRNYQKELFESATGDTAYSDAPKCP